MNISVRNTPRGSTRGDIALNAKKKGSMVSEECEYLEVLPEKQCIKKICDCNHRRSEGLA